MVDWKPYVLFLVSGVVAAFAERRYFEELARRGLGGVRSDDSWTAEVSDHPSRLPSVVASETMRRLRALLTRQPDGQAERLWLIAIVTIAVAIGCFLWTVLLVTT